MKNKKLHILILTLMICVFLLTACSGNQEKAMAEEATEVQTEEPATEPTEEPAEAEKTEEITKNSVLITDMAGREVEIPAEIETVFGVNNTASIILYTIVPTKIAGWNIAFSDKAKEYMADECTDLSVFGSLYGSGKKADAEEIISLAPDVIVIAGTKANDKLISSADDIQAQLGIPVVAVIGKMSTYSQTYEFLGEVLGEQKKAAELSEYAGTLVADITDAAALISQDDRVSVYYARGDDGLETEFAGSPNSEVLEIVGGINVIEGAEDVSSGTVSIEEITVQNPEVILIGNQGASKNSAYDAVTKSGLWDGIEAVKSGNVIPTPQYPFNWFDRPPTVNRLIGLIWLAEELYPDVYDYDVTQEVINFYKLFYGVEITAEQAETLMQ